MSKDTLPSIDTLRRLRRSGMSLVKIANQYGVKVESIYNKLSKGNENVSAFPDRSFTSTHKDPIEHRDTGEGTSWNTPLYVGSPKPHAKVPRDLRIEWGLDKWKPDDG